MALDRHIDNEVPYRNEEHYEELASEEEIYLEEIEEELRADLMSISP